MVVIMNADATQEDIEGVIHAIEEKGLAAKVMEGARQKIVGVIGDKTRLADAPIDAMHGVETTVAISKSYKLASREFHPAPTVIEVAGVQIGGGTPVVMAGPCAVESRSQLMETAEIIKAGGAQFLRGGAYKPRTSPYAFQGLGAQGLEFLKSAKIETGLPIVTELMDVRQLQYFADVDIIQIGARNMQNFDLLKEMGKAGKPILLKRGMAATVKELLMSAEYIMASGNENVILCERGVRTFDSYTRNCLDVSAVPYLHKVSHLPVIIDPSHACGMSWMVPTLAKAAVAGGADGLIIEVHNDPSRALCDGEQSLRPDEFASLMKTLVRVAEIEGRSV